MVRIVIEDSAWSDPRLKRLAAYLKTSTDHALAKLLRLWHASQSEGLCECDGESLAIWFELTKQDSFSELEDLIICFLKANYLEDNKGRFTIKGNREALESAEKRSVKAKNASSGRWTKKKIEGVNEVIAHYVWCFREKFSGKSPVITAVEAGAAKNLVKNLGIDKAKEAVEGYFLLKDAYHFNRLYPLQDLQQATILNKIGVTEHTGININQSMARQLEKTENNKSAGKLWLAEIEGKV